MPNTALDLNTNRVETLVRLARGALMLMAAVLLALAERAASRHRRLLRPFVARLERTCAHWLFLSASLRVVAPMRAPGHEHPRAAPSGFACARVKGCAFSRAMRTRPADRDLVQRLRRLYAIADNPRRAVRRLIKRLDIIAAHGLIPPRFVAIAPPALSLSTSARAPAPALADSS